MSKQNFDTAKEFLGAFEADITVEVQELRDVGTLTQESLVKAFESVAARYRDKIPANAVFTSNFTGGLYELVNITQKAITFTENGKEQLFHPRILLWTGNASPEHTHPADGKLEEGDVACVYYPVTPGAREVQYALADGAQGVAKTVELLTPGKVGIDRHSKDAGKLFAHKFIPADTEVPGVSVVNDKGATVSVRTITFNLYNAAGVSQAAKGEKVTDTGLDVTTKTLDKHRDLVERFKLSLLKIELAKDGWSKVDYKPQLWSQKVTAEETISKEVTPKDNIGSGSKDDWNLDYRSFSFAKKIKAEKEKLNGIGIAS